MATPADKPLVSIGMPTYNGERWIRESLDSLLAQDYQHFELNISDNASTDRTGDICQEYVRKDDRIRYRRNPTNLGALYNFRHVLELSTGKYFMWAADHDLWDPSFISRCVSVLEAHSDVVLAYPRAMEIDREGRAGQDVPVQVDTRSLPPYARYKAALRGMTYCYLVYGLFRRDVLCQTGLRGGTVAPDVVLLLEISLKGAFAHIPDCLFSGRRQREPEDTTTRCRRSMRDLDPTVASREIELSPERLHRRARNSLLWILLRAPISAPQKVHSALATMLLFRSWYGVRSPVLQVVEWIGRCVFPKATRRRIREWFDKM